MRTFALALSAALLALLALAGPAAAHVTVSSTDATQGGFGVVTFQVPTESATASTTGILVQLPPATPFASVSVQPTPGWTATTKSIKLARPITNDDGDQITEAVSQIDWTADSAGTAIKPGEFQQFTVSLGPLPKTSQVVFKAIQTYSDKSVVRWIETPAPGTTKEPDHPAPTLQLADPSGGGGSAVVTRSTGPNKAAKSDSSSNTGSVVLSIVALVVAAGALGLAFVSRARGRGAE